MVHFVSRFTCLLLLVIIMVQLVIHVHNDTFYNMIINVSESGQDSKICFTRGYSCKTLVYALQFLTDYRPDHFPSVLINVTYNQTINGPHNVGAPSIGILHITGNERVYIHFPHYESSLQIVHRYTWAWINLTFASRSFGIDCRKPSVTHFGDTSIQNSVSVLNSTLTSIAWKIVNVTNFVINSTEFSSKLCPTVCVEYSRNSQTHQCAITISNNIVCNCNLRWLSTSVFMVTNYNSMKDCVVEIANNTFKNLTNDENAHTQLTIWIDGNLESLTFSDNLFINNHLGCIYIYGNLNVMLAQGNIFYSNHASITYPYEIQTVLMELYYILSTLISLTNITFDQNIFSGNNQLQLLNIHVGKNYNSTLFVTLNNLHVLNNVGKSELITVANKVPKRAIVCTEMSHLVLENNSALMQDQTVENVETFVAHLVNINKVVFLDHTTFQNNLGTSLFIENKETWLSTSFCILGNLMCQQNSGLLGGAMALNSVIINTTCKSKILFKDNYSVYGGALYLEKTSCGVVSHATLSQTTLEFFGNSAMTAGNSIYFATAPVWNLENECLRSSNLNDTDVGSYATNILVHNQDNNYNSLAIFPGQSIILNTTITDHFGAPSSCTTSAILLCESRAYFCFDLHTKLSGPHNVVLAQTEYNQTVSIDTSLVVQSPEGYPNYNNINITLVLACKSNNSIKAVISLNITGCPQGFHYNPKFKMCQCALLAANIICSTKFGTSCIAHGYWYGKPVNDSHFTEYTVARCRYPECRYTTVPCPPEMQSDGGFIKLDYDSDSQCSYGRGGVLCRECAHNFVFSFLTVNCISESICNSWQPFLVTFFGVLFQVLIATLLLLVVRFKHALGSGFLYGPMLFLAVVSHLPLDNYSEYSALSDAVSIVTSIPLLNLMLFGRIPWCFFMIPKMYNYSLRFLGPMTVLVVLISITFISQRCPSNLRCLQKSPYTKFLPQNALQCWKAPPLKAVCILMLLSFWSLADTSINILTPTVFEFRESPPLYMVSIQPDIRYFSPQHLPVAIPALLVFLVLILPLVAVLLLSPFLHRVINLHRIMPFLDEFQSCYEDQYRWYSGVYFIVWLVIVGIQGLPDFLLYTQTIFIILLCAQSLIRPYKSKLLNITDTVLLIDINFLISLVYKHSYSPSSHVHMFSNLLTHGLVIVPFVCAIVSVTCMLVIKCGVCRYLQSVLKRRSHFEHLEPSQAEEQQQKRLPGHVTVQDVAIDDGSVTTEREPLIALVNDK